jgi:hypothetical protein
MDFGRLTGGDRLESSDPTGDVLFAATALTCHPHARRGEAHVVEHRAGVKELGIEADEGVPA